jgi:hypothetical protein
MTRCDLSAVWEDPAREAVVGAITALGADRPASVRCGELYDDEAKTRFKALI